MLHIQPKGMEQSIVRAHILSLHMLSAPWVGSNVNHIVFLKVVMLHIQSKGMEHRALCKHIVCPYTHPRSLGEVSKGQKLFF